MGLQKRIGQLPSFSYLQRFSNQIFWHDFSSRNGNSGSAFAVGNIFVGLETGVLTTREARENSVANDDYPEINYDGFTDDNYALNYFVPLRGQFYRDLMKVIGNPQVVQSGVDKTNL